MVVRLLIAFYFSQVGVAASNVERKGISPGNVQMLQVPEEAVTDVSIAEKEGICQEIALNQDVDVNFLHVILLFG